MTPWFTFAAITLFMGILFGWLLWRQNKRSQKRWLISQIKTDPEHKESYIDALNKLDKQTNHSPKTTLWFIVVLIPAALLLNAYLFPPEPVQTQQPPSIEEALAQLEQSLRDNPENLEGQLLYARAMMSMQNYAAAVTALKKADELSPNNANILTEWAEAVAFKNNTGSFLGEPETLIERALQADPSHQKALWLKGIIAFEKQKYPQAEQLWTTLVKNIRDDSVKTTIMKQINQARQQQNKPALNLSDLSAGTDASDNDQSIQPYQITLQASDTLKNQSFPATTRVFVSAKAPAGPPMPVAAVDLSPPFNWPITVELSDLHNLNPERRLSDYPQVIISARLSVSGDASISDYVSEAVTVSAENAQISIQLKPR